MTIPIEHEGSDYGPYENCCFCRAPTPMWTLLADRLPGEQVACCPSCASDHAPEDVPSKDAWCNEEAARMRQTYRMVVPHRLRAPLRLE